jgi:hypothetical protein
MQSMDLRPHRRIRPVEHTNQIGSASQRRVCLVEVVLAGLRDETISQEVPFVFCVDESNRIDAEVGRGGLTRGRWVLRRKERFGYRVTPQKLVERRRLCYSGPA